MKNYVIVGGHSQDSYYLSKLILKEQNSKIFLLVKKNSRKFRIKNKNIKTKVINIFSFNQVKKFLDKLDYFEIIFLASKNVASEEKVNNKIIIDNFNLNTIALINFLEYIEQFNKKSKLFYASSSHIFNNTLTKSQKENTKPSYYTNYGLSKYLGYQMCQFYRNVKNIYVTTGIFYSHYSKFSRKNFLIKKILKFLKNKNSTKLYVHSLKNKIDFLHASEVSDAIIKIMKLKKPDDFIVSSNQAIKINDLFKKLKSKLKVKNKKIIQKKISLQQNQTILLGNNKKLIKKTGWKPLNINSRLELFINNE